jgi:hypothetical protein
MQELAGQLDTYSDKTKERDALKAMLARAKVAGRQYFDWCR